MRRAPPPHAGEIVLKDLLTFGQILSVHARLSPERNGARDLARAMDDVPRNATGKVLHRVLKEQVMEAERLEQSGRRATG